MAKKGNSALSFEKEIKGIRNKLKVMIDEMTDAQVLALLSFIVTPPEDFDEGDFEDKARKFYDEDDFDDDEIPF